MSDLVRRLQRSNGLTYVEIALRKEAADRIEDADQVIKTLQAAGRMYLEGIIRRDQHKRDLRLAEKRIETLEQASADCCAAASRRIEGQKQRMEVLEAALREMVEWIEGLHFPHGVKEINQRARRALSDGTEETSVEGK